VACTLAGADRILAALEADLGIGAGQTTPDGAITLRGIPCAFVCAAAPVVEVDGTCQGRVTEEAARELAATAQARSATGEGGDG
jgi:NADH-quinone oxidoreductase subunit E